MSAIEMRKNSVPLILMEGILEKLKEREFPWIFSTKKFSTTWVLRYYVLRHAGIPDETFLLEQHEDCTPFSKVHKTLDLQRVVQIDTNISLKVGNQNWVLAIHYKTKRNGRLKILYLAAHSETDMNMWVVKLGHACKLQKQDDENHQLIRVPRENVVDEVANKFPFIADCMNDRYFTDGSVVFFLCFVALLTLRSYTYANQEESPTLSNIITNNANCIDSTTTHAYIRLKDCSSTHSLGSSSASLNSSIASSSTLSENLHFKNSFLIPPPIPPKPCHGSRIQKGGKHVFESGRYVLDQPLTPLDVHEILSIEEKEWSNETVRLDAVGSIDAKRTFLSCNSSLTPTVSNSSSPKPLPRRRNFRNIPPEIDRSCKPIGIRCIDVNAGQERSKTDDWKKEAFAASSRFLATNSSQQQPLHPVTLRNKQVPIGQEALYDNESVRATNSTLDYLDPVREPLVHSQPFIKSSHRPKISCATEYTLIDEESTKAVLKANVRQDEMRRNGFSV
uniref:PH domain-containing protein n=1 Tax=Elaeophora elaphi TaxID=1147741 RepID=A0A0R3RV03_9BILA